MKAFISHQSAIEFWRIQLVLPNGDDQRRCKVVLPDNIPLIEKAKLSGLTSPLHIMLGKANIRRVRKDIKQHVFTGKTPVGCFIDIDNAHFVSSPEFCFLQMAGIFPLVKLIELGYELCGSYSLHAVNDLNMSARGFHIRDSLMSAKKLEAFLLRMSGVKGHQKAMRALRYILNGSASPMETKLSMFLTLPYKLGGYGFAQPELNKRIVPSKTDKRFSSKTFFVCDLFWPDHRLAVEYDSESFHAGKDQIAEDSKRRNSLTMMGVTVITVTKQQIYDEKEFEKTAVAIAKCLGKRLIYKSDVFASKHNDLREQLL